MPARRIPATPLIGVALLSLAFPLAAQRDTVRLTDLVVTATRSESDRRTVAASVTTITGRDLEARGIRFVLDWLRQTPGVAVVQGGSFGAVTSLFVRGGESDYTRVLIDGVPANQPGGNFDLAHLTTDQVERIEMVRGPASVLYGSDAVTGVIQIFTRRGAGPAQGSVSARAGSSSSTDVSASAGGTTGGVSWFAGTTRFATDGIYPYNNRYRSQTMSARLGAAPDPRTDLALAARFGDHRAHFPTDFSGALADTNQFTTERNFTLSADAGRRLTEHVELRAQVGLFESTQGYDDARDGPDDDTGFGFEASRTAKVRRVLLDLRALVRPSERLTLSAGAERQHERQRNHERTTSDFGTGPFTDESRFERGRGNTAFYAQALAEPARDLHLQFGARYDDNEVFGRFGTWRAGVVLIPVPALRLHAAAGSAFRQPTFSEQFADTPFEVGDPDLRPERTASWEAGAEATVADRRVTISATWFAQRFRDMIQYRGAGPGEPTYVNVARARADGVELGVAASVAAALTVSGQFTRLSTEVKDDGGNGSVSFARGEALLRRPGTTWGAALSWSPAGRGSYRLSAHRTGERADVNFNTFPAERVTLEGYTTVEASAEVPIGERVAVTASGENLLGAKYQPVYGFRGRGRMMLAGLRLRF